jgi:hypothetical protein
MPLFIASAFLTLSATSHAALPAVGSTAAFLDFASWGAYPLGFLASFPLFSEGHRKHFLCSGDPDYGPFHHEPLSCLRSGPVVGDGNNNRVRLAIFTLPLLAWSSFSADADFGNLIRFSPAGTPVIWLRSTTHRSKHSVNSCKMALKAPRD